MRKYTIKNKYKPNLFSLILLKLQIIFYDIYKQILFWKIKIFQSLITKIKTKNIKFQIIDEFNPLNNLIIAK